MTPSVTGAPCRPLDALHDLVRQSSHPRLEQEIRNGWSVVGSRVHNWSRRFGSSWADPSIGLHRCRSTLGSCVFDTWRDSMRRYAKQMSLHSSPVRVNAPGECSCLPWCSLFDRWLVENHQLSRRSTTYYQARRRAHWSHSEREGGILANC